VIRILLSLKHWLEAISGARPVTGQSTNRAIGRGFWWALLLLLAISMMGRATKFIYVDF
jgi:hypothetical protein